jgi:hypothetical protein
MNLSIDGVLIDGTEGSRVQSVQSLTWNKGEDGVISISVVNTAGDPVDLTNYIPVLTVRRTEKSAAPLVVLNGTVTDAPGGLADFPVDEIATAAATYSSHLYDVWLVSTDNKHYLVVPASTFVIKQTPFDSGNDQTVNGQITGVPVVADAAIDAGALIKASATAHRYEMLGTTDDATLMVGVAVTAAAAQGDTFRAQFVAGTVTKMLNDGTGTIDGGASVVPSSAVAGRIKAGAGANVVGVNVGGDVAATLDAQVEVL